MDESLRDVAQQGSIDALYSLIQRDTNVFDRINEIPFVDTPLHLAASLGHTQFAMEVMKLKPSFARKLNQDGFTPMHLALQKHHALENDHVLQRHQTLLVHRLLDDDEDLVRVRGREGVTPLHYAAQIGNLPLLTKFLQVCPKSLEDVTIRRENVLHIALKYDMVKAFQLVLRWIRRACFRDAKLLEEQLLFWRDEEGNTLLHVAVSRNQLEVVSWLMDTRLVDLEAKNLVGDTVFDILKGLTQEDSKLMKKRLRQGCVSRLRARVTLHIRPALESVRKQQSDRLMVRIRRQETAMTDDRRNALLVVAALLLTVTYQAALSAPAEAQDANKNMLNGYAFLLGNTITYFLTNVTLLFLVPPDFIGLVLYLLLVLLSFCYCLSTPLQNMPSIVPIPALFPVFIFYLFIFVFTGKRVKRVTSFDIK